MIEELLCEGERVEMYEYYLIQVGEQFVANRYCDASLTKDEEQACAYTTFEAAVSANKISGVVVKRAIDDIDLEQLTVDTFSEEQLLAIQKELAAY